MTATPNIELAERVLRNILTFPEEHNQENWFEVVNLDFLPEEGFESTVNEDGSAFESHQITLNSMKEGSCGTSACVAGWAALEEGWKVKYKQYFAPDGNFSSLYDVYNPAGELVQADISGPEFEEAGKEALGISDSDASILFFTMDEREAIISLYSLVKAGSIHALSLWDVAEMLGVPFDEGAAADPDDDEAYFDLVGEVVETLRRDINRPAEVPAPKAELAGLSL